jgi:hypothetical protein
VCDQSACNSPQPGTVVITEGVNLLLHGLSPHGVMFTLGGTIINFLMVFGYVSGRQFLTLISEKIRQTRAKPQLKTYLLITKLKRWGVSGHTLALIPTTRRQPPVATTLGFLPDTNRWPGA